MRRLWFASFVAVLACSEGAGSDTRVQPAQVNWMEWPAEVLAATPFTVRLVGYYGGAGCGPIGNPVTTPTVDESAVTFEPYFLVRGDAYPCRYLDAASSAPAARLVVPPFDTRAAVAGLEAPFPRTYEIRAGTDARARALAAYPIRHFGDITVQSAAVTTDRINAGGLANAVRDSLGCVTLWPHGLYPGYQIENPPADTATSWSAFVRGYLYEPAAPVCGKSKVFHLMSRN
jgi:hypothetical protein